MLEISPDIKFEKNLCRLQIGNLRKTRPLVESDSKFHVGHIYKEIKLLFQQVQVEDADRITDGMFDEVERIHGIPLLLNTLILECIRHNCAPVFLRDVIDHYDSNGDISGVKLLISLNRIRRTIWEFNILEKVENIEEMCSIWSFRRCVFEMECMHEVRPALYTPAMLITKMLTKTNHYPKLDEFATNSMLVFDMLHEEVLEGQSGNTEDKENFSFDHIQSSMLLECIKSLGIDIDTENISNFDETNKLKKRSYSRI